MFEISEETNAAPTLGAKIRVVGVGGGGCNAVNTMIRAGLSGVEYIVANTDAQALSANLAPTKVQLGAEITKGLGAGANPEVGRKAALDEYEKLSEVLQDSDMVFITAGMGGGTGTGAAPVIAKLAKELGALTVGVVTKPFVFEGKRRFRQAESGIATLEENVDSLITIPNQRLLYLAGESLSLVDTFKKADEVLLNAVRGISDLINNTGHINADFADVSTVMMNKGLALMGTGLCSGPDRAIKAATEAISSPLLEDITIDGATGIIINVTGNDSLTMHETNEAVTLIMEAADDDAEIIFGTVIDNDLEDNIKVTVIATGLGGQERVTAASVKPVPRPTPTPVQETWQASNNTQPERRVEPVAATRTEWNETTTAVPAPQQERWAEPAGASRTEWEDDTRLATTEERRVVETPVRTEAELPTETPFVARENGNNITQEERGFTAREALEETNPMATSGLAESIREAASRYETTKTGAVETAPAEYDRRPEDNTTRETRAKSIAEKLGFINFDEDELDTPSYLRKEERNERDRRDPRQRPVDL